MKVICAGYPKTGTKSMREALEILGYDNVHDILEQISFDYVVMKKALLDENSTIGDIKKAYANVDSITDVPAVFMWEKIFEAFPKCKVILTVRDSPEVWLKSFEKLKKADTDARMLYTLTKILFTNRFCPTYKKFTQFFDFINERGNGGAKYRYGKSTEKAQLGYVQHNANVIKKCPKDQLLVYNVKEGWNPICKFLEKNIPKQEFPKRNTGHSVVDDFENNTWKYDAGLISKMQWEIKRLALVYLLIFVGILAGILLFFW